MKNAKQKSWYILYREHLKYVGITVIVVAASPQSPKMASISTYNGAM